MKRATVYMILVGAAAGSINGLFGAGGGMILVPLLSILPCLTDDEIFPSSICIMLPMCAVSLLTDAFHTSLPWTTALPYLIGSAVGGILAGIFGKNIPTKWLHKGLGIMILYGGVRYLC